MNCCSAALSRGWSTTAPVIDALREILPSALAPCGTRGAAPTWPGPGAPAPADDATPREATTTTPATSFLNDTTTPMTRTPTRPASRAHPSGTPQSFASSSCSVQAAQRLQSPLATIDSVHEPCQPEKRSSGERELSAAAPVAGRGGGWAMRRRPAAPFVAVFLVFFGV